MKQLFALLFALCLLTGCASRQDAPAPGEQEAVVIALLDTGVSTAAIDSETLLPGWNYVTGTADTEDRINHGTAVASVIAGCESAGVEAMAPEARLVPLAVADKVEGEVVSVAPEVLAQAIRDSVEQYGADIVNVSIGIKKDTPEVRKAVKYARKQGALVIAAVGNDGKSEDLYYPAACEGVLGVGSCDKYGQLSDFSQQNGTADLLAPGEDIWLASRNGKTYGAKGTSYATGFVSAAAARLWRESPELSAKAVEEQLLTASAQTAEGCPVLDREAVLAGGTPAA